MPLPLRGTGLRATENCSSLCVPQQVQPASQNSVLNVTSHVIPPSGRDAERWPAGDFTVQSTGGEGLPAWTKENRSVENEDVVLWHSFGLLHVPRVEDFPVMPCESTGFTLKPDGFFAGNPTIDLAPSAAGDGKSECCSHVD